MTAVVNLSPFRLSPFRCAAGDQLSIVAVQVVAVSTRSTEHSFFELGFGSFRLNIISRPTDTVDTNSVRYLARRSSKNCGL